MIIKLYDERSTFSVIGSLLNQPDLFVTGAFKLQIEDFAQEQRFHKIVFSAIYNVYIGEERVPTILEIDSYISKFKDQYNIFVKNKGKDWLEQAKRLSSIENYNKHCENIKKFALLRDLNDKGFPIEQIYDENNEDKVKQFEDMSIKDIIIYFNKNISEVEVKYSDIDDGIQAGENLEEQVEEYKQKPEMGIDSGINAINHVLYGLRKKYYLFSAASGFGKTRSLAYFSLQTGIKKHKPTLFITSELDYSEIQAMMLAGISGVMERHIILGQYKNDEEKVVRDAIDYMKESNLYIVHMPDFTIEKIEQVIKRYILLHDVEYVFFDYIKPSMSIITNVNKQAGGGLQTHQILTLLSEKLKSLQTTYDVGVYSATQLNTTMFFNKDNTESNQSQLAGAKAIADFCDVGVIIRPASQKEIETYDLMSFNPEWDDNIQYLFYDIYKNRRGLKNVSIGVCTNLGNLNFKEMVSIRNNDIMRIPTMKFD